MKSTSSVESGQAGAQSAAAEEELVPRISPLLLRFFQNYLKRHIARHFHAVRIARAGLPPPVGEGPLIIYLNHPSWWDPLIAALLAYRYFPDRTHYTAMDSEALHRHRFFEKLGFFGVEGGTAHGAVEFLRRSRAILARPRTALWLTPQVRFTDPRERSIHLAGGLTHLAWRLEQGTLLPLAIEYPFWNEQYPEVLVPFGSPIPIEGHIHWTVPEWESAIINGLNQTQAALALDSIRREPEAFETVLTGREGAHGADGLWQWLASVFGGKAHIRNGRAGNQFE